MSRTASFLLLGAKCSDSCLSAWKLARRGELRAQGGKTGLTCVQTKSSEVTDELLIQSGFNTFLFLTDSQLGERERLTPWHQRRPQLLRITLLLCYTCRFFFFCVWAVWARMLFMSPVKTRRRGRPVLILHFIEERIFSSKTALQERTT